MGCKQRKQGVLQQIGARKTMQSFSQVLGYQKVHSGFSIASDVTSVHDHQVGMVDDRQKAKKKNNLVLLTQRGNKVSKLKAGYEYQEILKNKSDFKVQNLPLMLSSCHDDGSRTLWLPKLENAIYQNF